MSGFGTLQPRTGSKDSVRLEEVIKMHKWPADEWSQVRFLPGKILPVKRHWITLLAGKEKKEIAVPRYCITFDVNNENEPRMMKNPDYKKGSSKPKQKDKMIPIPCPYCTLTHGQNGSARYEFFYLANAIIREVQEDMPSRAKKDKRTKEEEKTGFKDIRSKTWTPVEVCRITSSVATRIKELGDGNYVKKGGEKKAFDVTHEKYGIDIRVKFKPKGAGTDKYSADKDERTPLTKDELGYLRWDLSEKLIEVTGRKELKDAIEDFKRMEVVGGEAVDDDDDEGYNLGDSKKSKKGEKSKKKSGAAFADDDEDDDDKPKKKKKSSDKKSKSKSDDKPKKKKKPAFSDDDDDDDKPSKKSKKSGDKAKSKDKVKSKKKKDDEPKKKKSSDKKSKSGDKAKSKDKVKSSKKKSKKSAWDDDDE